MDEKRDHRHDDVSSAPESGTNRDETTGNQPANPQERAGNRKDDPSHAGEEP